MAQQVGEVVGRVLDGLRDAAHVAERQGVPRLQQLPARAGQRDRVVGREQVDAQPGGEEAAAAAESAPDTKPAE